MAEKKESKKLERTYIVPLRRKTVKTQRYLRAKKAVSVIRKFMERHMKADDIKIGQELNEVIWARGGKYVPGKLQLTAVKEDDTVHVNLTGVKPKAEKKETKKEAKGEKKAAPKKEAAAPSKPEAKHEHKHTTDKPPAGITEEVIKE